MLYMINGQSNLIARFVALDEVQFKSTLLC